MVRRLIFLSLVCAYVGLTRGEALALQADSVEEAPKHIFGIIPNFRTTESSETYQPATPKEKFRIAAQDSFDRGTVALGTLFGGQAMLSKSTPSFGYGVSGAAKYVAGSYADYVVGNYLVWNHLRRGIGFLLSDRNHLSDFDLDAFPNGA